MRVYTYHTRLIAGGPFTTDYMSVNARYKTYRKWPIGLRQTAEELVTAGFYYSGFSDRVICFHCGYGACDWTSEDCPILEHYQAIPACSYIQSVAALHSDSKSCKYRDSVETTEKTSDNQSVDSVLLCKICFENSCSVVILPCRHFVACGLCASQLDKCAVCRGSIDDTLTVFTC